MKNSNNLNMNSAPLLSGLARAAYVNYVNQTPAKLPTTKVIDLITNGRFIQQVELDGETDIEIIADWDDSMQFDDFDGTALTPYRVFLNGNKIGGVNIAASEIVYDPNGSYWEVYDGVIQGDPTGLNSGVIGLRGYPSAAPGSFLKYQNLVVKDIYFANGQWNITRVGEQYKKIELYDVRAFGHPVEGEGLYGGDTSIQNVSMIRNFIVDNFLAYDKGRDGVQFTNVVPEEGSDVGVQARRMTVYQCAILQDTGQLYNLQFQNSRGVIEFSMFDSLVRPFIIAANDLTVRHCFFNNYSVNGGLIQDVLTNFPDQEAVNNKPIFFIDCEFRGEVGATYLTQIHENQCSIYFINCKITDNILNLWEDLRTDTKSYSIADIGTQVVPLSSMPAPTYLNFDSTDLDNHGKVTSIYHNKKGFGFRSKIDGIVDSNSAPFPPQNVVATPNGQTQVDLTWNAPLNNGGSTVTGYQIERATVSTGWTVIESDVGLVTSYSDTNGVQNTTYYYRISAISALGVGLPSDSGSATTEADARNTDVFTDVSIDYQDMTFVGGDGTDLVTAVNRGDDGVVTEQEGAALAKNDAIIGGLEFLAGVDDRISVPRAALAEGYTYGFVMYIPSTGSGTRNISAISGTKNVRIDGSRVLFVNNVNTGITLPADTLFALRIYLDNAAGSYVQIDTGTKTSIAVNDSGVNFGGATYFGGRHDANSPFHGTMEWMGLENTDVSDASWALLVGDYIP